MKTVKEWIDFLENDNYVFGLQKRGGMYCKKYFSANEARKIFDGYLEEMVVNAYPMNYVKDNIIHCLLEY